MGNDIIVKSLEILAARSLPGGGFGITADGTFRTDATAWTVLALLSANFDRNLCENCGTRLAKAQQKDGRIPLTANCPEACWPTSLAILAWHKLEMYEKEKGQAINFLLTNTGEHWKRKEKSLIEIDPSLKGWPWIENTFSWVVPTSESMLALKACDFISHERVQQGGKMLLDRQLPSGGWNFGNVAVFGKEFRPAPETTGHALCALAGLVDQKTVQKSISYLNEQIQELRTPLSLSWAGFALNSWGEPLANFQNRIIESLLLQEKYGSYDTALLSQLLLAYFTKGNLQNFLSS